MSRLLDKVITSREAYTHAMRQVAAFRSGKEKPVRTKWNNLNAAWMDGMLTGWYIVLAGRSSSGKTAFLNELLQSLHEANPGFAEDIEILNFNLEMQAKRLVQRDMSKKLQITMKQLLLDISDDEFEELKQSKKEFHNKGVHYVESVHRIDDIVDLISEFAEAKNLTIIDENGKKSIDSDKILIVALDHALAIERSGNQSDELYDLSYKVDKLLTQIPNLIFILLTQLNDNIEKPERRSNRYDRSFLHYPERGDIYGIRSTFHFADEVLVIHDPYDLKIPVYGPKRIKSKGKLFLHRIKGRDTGKNLLVFSNNLRKNTIDEYELGPEDYVKSSKS